MKLNESTIGDVLTIINIDVDIKIKNRLQDMGLIKGSCFRLMAYYSKNAYILNIRGSRVVIGNEIAQAIEVEKINCARKRLRKHGGHFRRGFHGKNCI